METLFSPGGESGGFVADWQAVTLVNAAIKATDCRILDSVGDKLMTTGELSRFRVRPLWVSLELRNAY